MRVLTSRLLAVAAGMITIAAAIPAAASSPAQTNDIVGTNVNGDSRSDVVLTGVPGWTTLPLARSTGGGHFSVSNPPVGDFATWASTPGVTVLAGDFNGDGRTDVALTGVPGWTTLPVAYATGSGGFTVVNGYVGDFATWAGTPGVLAVTGDFNGDGRTDVALTGAAGWATVPTATATATGRFTIANNPVGDFATWASSPGAKVLTGDFNGDRRSDLAVTGVAGWATLPIATSSGAGFYVSNTFAGDFAAWASAPGVHAIAADFNGDGFTDVALTGARTWATVPVATSTGFGGFMWSNQPAAAFAGWAATPGVRVLCGDFDGDGRADLALTGVAGWASVPVASARGVGAFAVTNYPAGPFAVWAATPGVSVLTGDYNGDRRSDLALIGGPDWTTLPVATSLAGGRFSLTNNPVGVFATWAATTGAMAVTTTATAPR